MIAVPAPARRCRYCETPLAADRDPRTRYCDNKCRARASHERGAEQALAALQVRSNGHSKPTRDAERLRERRARGPVPSDMRISFPRAVTETVHALRTVARVSARDAHVIATDAMIKALPKSKQQPGARA